MINIKKNTVVSLTKYIKNNKKCNTILRSYFSRNNTSIEKVLSQNGWDINKCGFCNEFSYVKEIKFVLNNYTNSIYVNDIIYLHPHKCNSKSCPSKNYNPNSREFVEKVYGLSANEALKFIHKRNKSPFYVENHATKNDYLQSQTRNEEFFIKKYNEKKGKIKYNNFINNHKYSYTEEAYIKKYGVKGIEIKKSIDKSKALSIDKMGKDKWDKWRFKWSNKKSDYINKYGQEIGLEKYNNYVKEKKYKSSLQYYIDQYGEKAGLDKWQKLCKSQGINKKNLINKYGKKEGLIKYKNFINSSVINNVKFNNSSKEAWNFFKPIIKYCFSIGILKSDIYIGTCNRNEFFLKTNESIYFYDFCIRSKKIIIEYHGEKFHPNPNWNNETWSNWKSLFSNISADKKRKQDIVKQNCAKKHNFNIEEVFSSDNFDEKYKILFDLIKRTNNVR